MVVTPGVVRRLRGRTSALDLDTESGRAFLQERVAFFNKVAFCISGAFFVVAVLAGPYYGDPSPPLVHAATLVVSLAAWQVCGRGPGLSTGLLGVIDAAAVTLVLVGFAAQALLVPPAFAGEVAHSLVLIFTNMVVVRAVVVPSTAARTAGLSLLAALPALAAILLCPRRRVPPRSSPGTTISGRGCGPRARSSWPRSSRTSSSACARRCSRPAVSASTRSRRRSARGAWASSTARTTG